MQVLHEIILETSSLKKLKSLSLQEAKILLKKKKRRPPPQDCFKTNFDRALFNESNEASLGIVIRNSEGQVMATLLEKIKKPPSVVTLDLLAARRAAAFVSKTGFQQSCFESDTKIVIKSL